VSPTRTRGRKRRNKNCRRTGAVEGGRRVEVEPEGSDLPPRKRYRPPKGRCVVRGIPTYEELIEVKRTFFRWRGEDALSAGEVNVAEKTATGEERGQGRERPPSAAPVVPRYGLLPSPEKSRAERLSKKFGSGMN
jgi:hypothetical protein